MIHTGDCVEVMRELPADSIDAIVTDPPYNLGFMGKAWDQKHQHEPWAREAFRVAKPGAHLVAAGGTRTFHRLVCALEDAGWEIRDTLIHCYASGFPKSLNLPGGLGTALKPAFEPWTLARKPLRGTVAANVLAHGTGALNIDATRIGTGDDLNGGGYSGGAPTGSFGRGHLEPEQFVQPAGRWPANLILTDPIFDGDTPGVVGGGTVTSGTLGPQHTDNGKDAGTLGAYSGRQIDQTFGGDSGTYSRFFLIPKSSRSDREPLTRDEAYRLHRESGACDKLPAWRRQDLSPGEPTDSTSPARATSARPSTDARHSDTSSPGSRSTDQSPAVISSTISTATSRTTRSRTSSSSTLSPTSASIPAASFDPGNGGSPAPSADDSSLWGTPTGTSPEKDGPSTDGADPATSKGSYRTGGCADCGKPLPRVSSHPTVKPVDLMRHLVRLVTPPGGTVLDPFLGSGTTAIAAEMEGFAWVGIEKEAEYVAIAEARLNGTQRGLGLDVAAPTRKRELDPRSIKGRNWNGLGGFDSFAERHLEWDGLYRCEDHPAGSHASIEEAEACIQQPAAPDVGAGAVSESHNSQMEEPT